MNKEVHATTATIRNGSKLVLAMHDLAKSKINIIRHTRDVWQTLAFVLHVCKLTFYGSTIRIYSSQV